MPKVFETIEDNKANTHLIGTLGTLVNVVVPSSLENALLPIFDRCYMALKANHTFMSHLYSLKLNLSHFYSYTMFAIKFINNCNV